MASLKRLAAALALFGGCGALVDERFEGTPLLTLRGSPQGDPAPFEATKDLMRAAIFYFPKGPTDQPNVDAAVEHVATRLSVRPPTSFEWNLYDLPEAQHLVTLPSGRRYGLGVPYAYIDLNNDGRRNVDEAVVGEASTTAVIWVETALTAAESPTGSVLPVGFYKLARPMACRLRPPEPTPTDDTCGVPIGGRCMTNAECGVGTCLQADPWPWPNGLCTLSGMSTCVPRGAHLWRNHRDPRQSYWLPVCATNAECGLGYECDPGYLVCLPTTNSTLVLDSTRPRLPICQPSMPMPMPP